MSFLSGVHGVYTIDWPGFLLQQERSTVDQHQARPPSAIPPFYVFIPLFIYANRAISLSGCRLRG